MAPLGLKPYLLDGPGPTQSTQSASPMRAVAINPDSSVHDLVESTRDNSLSQVYATQSVWE